jgi:CubicO group peptidase (beta-lactamase class C family)
MKSTLIHIRLAILVSVLLLSSCKNVAKQNHSGLLPRSTPETEGVDSKGIIDFIQAAGSSHHEFHSFMLLRHGKVIAEGWWYPYAPDLKHTLYSTSKSFTSTAVGFAVTENHLKTTDKVISFFPDYLPDIVSQYLREMEVKDLLTMSAGQDPDPTGLIPSKDTNWIRAFLALPVVNEPGTKFLYNSMATYMLSAIVQKVTGEKVIDYLTPRLFNPLGITGMDWETDPMGINTGGWGLRLKTEDMAKFGQLYLQNGMWNGTQVIPAEWIKEATTFKIDQMPGAPDSVRSKNDWAQGYCYQFWRCRNNGFRADGAYGQYIIVLPDKDAVAAITCESPDMPGELNLVWDHILPALKDEPLPENPGSCKELGNLLGSLAVKLPPEGVESGLQHEISGKTYLTDPNEWGVESLSLDFNDASCSFKMKGNGNSYDFRLGSGNWETVLTRRPDPNLLLKARKHLGAMPQVKVAGIYRWRDDKTLELTLRYIESPHTETLTCTFDGNNISVNRKVSFTTGRIGFDLKGHEAM